MTKGEASGYFFLFAEEEGRLLGYTCFGPIPGSVHSYDLYWIAVDPTAQGWGLGKKLMADRNGSWWNAGPGASMRTPPPAPSTNRPAPSTSPADILQEAFLADFYAAGDGKVIFVKSPARNMIREYPQYEDSRCLARSGSFGIRSLRIQPCFVS